MACTRTNTLTKVAGRALQELDVDHTSDLAALNAPVDVLKRFIRETPGATRVPPDPVAMCAISTPGTEEVSYVVALPHDDCYESLPLLAAVVAEYLTRFGEHLPDGCSSRIQYFGGGPSEGDILAIRVSSSGDIVYIRQP